MSDPTSQLIADMNQLLSAAQDGLEIRDAFRKKRSSFSGLRSSPVGMNEDLPTRLSNMVTSMLDEREEIISTLIAFGAKWSSECNQNLIYSLRDVLLRLSGIDQQYPRWREYLSNIQALDPNARVSVTTDGSSWYLKTDLYIASRESASYGSISPRHCDSEPAVCYSAWSVITKLKSDQFVVVGAEYDAAAYTWDGTKWCRILTRSERARQRFNP